MQLISRLHIWCSLQVKESEVIEIFIISVKNHERWAWWLPVLILELRKSRQVDLCEFFANLIYTVSSKFQMVTAKAISENKTSIASMRKPTRNVYSLHSGE